MFVSENVNIPRSGDPSSDTGSLARFRKTGNACGTRRWWRGRGAGRRKDNGRPRPPKCASESCVNCTRQSHSRTEARARSSPARKLPDRAHPSPHTTCRWRSDRAPKPHRPKTATECPREVNREGRVETSASVDRVRKKFWPTNLCPTRSWETAFLVSRVGRYFTD
jgi:hypothetical protein